MTRNAQLNLKGQASPQGGACKTRNEDRRILSAYVERVLEDYLAKLKGRKPKP
jgi:hypothetical protein